MLSFFKNFYSAKNREKCTTVHMFWYILLFYKNVYKYLYMKKKSHKNIKLHNCFELW